MQRALIAAGDYAALETVVAAVEFEGDVEYLHVVG